MNPRTRRLSLRKNTVRNLSPEAASNVRGGATVTCHNCHILPATEDIDCLTQQCTVYTGCVESLCFSNCGQDTCHC